jgi:tRNA(His) 5'-end guanylyltransferase
LCDGLGQFDDAPTEPSLAESAASVMNLLRTRNPEGVSGMDPSLHYFAPHVNKATWSGLGDLVAARESSSFGSVPGHRWISLRLDGCGFSRTVRVLRSKGILEPEGFSDTFASCMTSALYALMEHFHARLGYTQSDEMIVFLAPTNVVRGERQPHMRNGRVTKITTLAASFVTSHFIMQLAKKCEAQGLGLEDLSHIVPHFDCRLGHYECWEEARALLMWRAYDCSVNGVSDAVYHIKGAGKEVMSLGKVGKVEWLWKQDRLPLPRHQSYGTVLVRVKRVKRGDNPKLGTTVESLRGVLEHVNGPVLELLCKDALFPLDDLLLQ